MDRIPGRARVARFFLLILVAILAFIVLTGGGRLGPVDFKSIGAWALPTLYFAAYVAVQPGRILPPWFSKLAERISAHPFVVLSVLFAAIATAHLARMMSFHVNVFDAGFLYQPIFQAFSKPFLKCDLCYSGSFLAVHQAFTLPVLTPFAALAGTPLVLPILLAFGGGLCAWFVARSYRRELLPSEVTFLFLAIFSIRGFREGFLFDLREDLLGAIFFSLGLLVARTGRFYLALIPFALATLSKETGVFLFPFAGLAVLLENERFKQAPWREKSVPLLIYGLLGIGFFALIFGWSLPAWSPHGGGESDFVKRLSFLGHDPREIFSTLFFHPLRATGLLLGTVATFSRLKYLIFTLLPFLPFFRKGWNFYYLPGLVLLAGNLISSSDQQRMMQFHYELFALPFFAFGLAESLRSMKARKGLEFRWLGVYLLWFLCFSGTWPLSHLREFTLDSARIADFRWSREQAGKFPAEAPVLLDALTLPTFSDRQNIRYLAADHFDPDAPNLLNSIPIGDSRFAILQKAWGNQALGADWKSLGCGPDDFICVYEKR